MTQSRNLVTSSESGRPNEKIHRLDFRTCRYSINPLGEKMTPLEKLYERRRDNLFLLREVKPESRSAKLALADIKRLDRKIAKLERSAK